MWMYTHILNWSTQSALILCSLVFLFGKLKSITQKNSILFQKKSISKYEYLKKGKCHDLKQNDLLLYHTFQYLVLSWKNYLERIKRHGRVGGGMLLEAIFEDWIADAILRPLCLVLVEQNVRSLLLFQCHAFLVSLMPSTILFMDSNSLKF